jgi:hypothetical protein
MLQPVSLGPWKGIYQSEGCDKDISKATVTVDQNQNFGPGQVLGMVTAQADTYAVAAAVAKAGNAGNGTAVLTGAGVGAGIQVGTYKVRALGPLVWEFQRPDGSISETEVADGVAYVDQLLLTVTHGATPFAAGDEFSFAVTVSAAAANLGLVKAWDPAATDGSEVAYGIAYEGVVTGAGENRQIVAHVRECRVWGKYLTYASDANAGQIAAANAQLAQNFLIVA